MALVQRSPLHSDLLTSFRCCGTFKYSHKFGVSTYDDSIATREFDLLNEILNIAVCATDKVVYG